MLKSNVTKNTRRNRRSVKQKVAVYLKRGFIYTSLSLFALCLLIPFVYMISTSLKTSEDSFRYPPRLLPYTQHRTEAGLALYQFEISGEDHQLVQTDERVRVGFFAEVEHIDVETPRSSQPAISLPLDQALPTGQQVSLSNASGDSKLFDLYNIPDDAEAFSNGDHSLALAYQGMMTRYTDPQETKVTALSFPRLAVPSEFVDPRVDNYQRVLELGLWQAFVNTVFVTLGVTLGQLITSIMGGYAFSRLRFPGRDQLFLLYLGSIMIPFAVLIIPLYRLMVAIGWQGELVALIIPWMFTAYGTFLMRQAFSTIPRDLEDAALIDGATRWRILWSVLTPLCKPTITTLAVFSFLYAWNSFLWPFIIIGQGNDANHVLTLSLTRLNAAYDQRPNLVMASATIAILPPSLIFLIGQKHFVKAHTNSGLK